MEWISVVKLNNPQDINRIEDQLGIKFPKEFTDLVKEHNHGSAFPDTFDTENRKGKAFGRLLDFNLGSKDNILHEYELIQDKLPEKVFPFAGDAGGNYLCFDYRKSGISPEVVFWDHEQEFEIEGDELIIPDHEQENEYYLVDFVSKDLSELFKKLYGDRDEEFEKWKKREVIWENFMDEEQLRGLTQDKLDGVNARRAQKGLPPIVKE